MNAIVAVNSDWGIGYKGGQTVVIPKDRRRFKEKTVGGVVIVGRKTFEAIPGPLPNRKNIVLTRDLAFAADGAVVKRSMDEALLEIAGIDPNKVFVIGGGDIYKIFLPMCGFAYVTKIDAAPRSDTFFPDLDASPDWALERSESGIRDSELGIKYSINTYRNTNGGAVAKHKICTNFL